MNNQEKTNILPVHDNLKQTNKETDFKETIEEAQEWIKKAGLAIKEHSDIVDKQYNEIMGKGYAYFEKALVDKNSDQYEKFLKAIDRQAKYFSQNNYDFLEKFPRPEQELFPDKAPGFLNKVGIKKALELISSIQPDLNKRTGNLVRSQKTILNNLIFSAILNKGLPAHRLTEINELAFPECFKDDSGDNYGPLVNFSKSLNIKKLKGSGAGRNMPGAMQIGELEGHGAGFDMPGVMRVENKLKGDNAGWRMPGTMCVNELEGNYAGEYMSGVMQVDKLEGDDTGFYMSGTMLFTQKQGSFGDELEAGASIYWHDQDKYYIVYEKGSDYTINEEYKVKKEEVKAISNKDDKDIVSIGLRTDPQTNEPNKQGLWILDNINGLDHNIPLFEKGILILRKMPKSPRPLIKEMTNGIIIIEDKDFKGDQNDIVSDFKGGIIEIKDPEADKGKRVILGNGEVGV